MILFLGLYPERHSDMQTNITTSTKMFTAVLFKVKKKKKGSVMTYRSRVGWGDGEVGRRLRREGTYASI